MNYHRIPVVMLLCVIVCGVFHLSLAGLNTEGSVLTISKNTFYSDIVTLKNSLNDTCRIGTLNVYAENFTMTTEYVRIFENCPLTEINLGKSCGCWRQRCFSVSEVSPSRDDEMTSSPYFVDLSNLTSLEFLNLDFCHKTRFIITALPKSLWRLYMGDSTEKSIHLNNSFGGSLLELYVEYAYQCCPGLILHMFGRELPEAACSIPNERLRTIDVSESWQVIICGLSAGGKKLTLVIENDVSVLRHQLNDECHVNHLLVPPSDFALTNDDINILSRCPLKLMEMIDSGCFSGPFLDLSKLKDLEKLDIRDCRQSHFVFTGLPASLQVMYIPGLREYNIQLEDGDSGFGDSLTKLRVFSGGMCCNYTMSQMFSKNLSSICSSADGNNCGLTDRGRFGFTLSVDDREYLQSYLHNLRSKCLSGFSGAGRHFFLTQDDLDILSRCPETKLNLQYTSCFSGPVDLSGFAGPFLNLRYCTHLNFTITGISPKVQRLDMRGMGIDNIDIQRIDKTFVDKFGIDVSDPNICRCPQAVMKMFGKPLPEWDAWGWKSCIVRQEYLVNFNFNSSFPSTGIYL